MPLVTHRYRDDLWGLPTITAIVTNNVRSKMVSESDCHTDRSVPDSSSTGSDYGLPGHESATVTE